MSVIHRTTLKPTKLELLTPWLPAQPWYAGAEGQRPELDRTGGFRLDDPAGEVGIEFMVVTDTSGPEPVSYHVPLTYRGAPLPGADHALIGTTEHGVLGDRWVYDGAHDPVVAAQLYALLLGEAEPQMQRVSDTPDPSVTARFTGQRDAAGPTVTSVTSVTDAPHGTDITLTTASGGGPLILRVQRVLGPGEESDTEALGEITADALRPDGTPARAVFVTAHAQP
ncbi:1,4-alpha-glucan branching protein [Streptomyces sp. NPDC015144]|uniref:maltokinase N-terminal cap-like domain-containing protein n=1 Tax=Streptomyces sp. NPDC015144 TaxID=3364944 RepID=UPI0036FDC221